MFRPVTLLALGGLLLLGALYRQQALVLLALAPLLADGLSRVWGRYCLDGIEYRRRLSRDRVPFGETVELELEVVNRKLLPLAWLEIEEEIPRGLEPARGKVLSSGRPGRALLAGLATLRPYERLVRRYRIRCAVRGEHALGPARLRSGDLFASSSRTLDIAATDSLLVYPRVVPLAELGLPSEQPLGDLRTRSWLFEDPTRFAGVREYRPEDSLRRVHWAASARSRQLQVKVYEPTTSRALVIFLNADASGSPDAIELAITTAASIAAWGAERGYRVGLRTNAATGPHGLAAPGTDAERLPRILEALARVTPAVEEPYERTLEEAARQLKYGETVVAVAAALSPAQAAALDQLRVGGHPVALLLTGSGAADAHPTGVRVQRIGPPESWRDAEVLSPVEV